MFQKNTIFQPAEVISVNWKDSNPRTLYSILAKPIYKGRSPSNATVVQARPQNPNEKKPPLIGEVVLLIPGPSEDAQAYLETISYYYTQPIGLQNNIHHNAFPKVSNTPFNKDNNTNYKDTTSGHPITEDNPDNSKLGNSFQEKNNIRPLQLFEGDYVLEGRWGNSIRFGSTLSKGLDQYTLQPDWTEGNDGDPITIIRNGQPDNTQQGTGFLLENINNDKSCIYLTGGQRINLQLASTVNNAISNNSINSYSSGFIGNQIILNTDRIVLNSKTKEILLSSKGGIGLSSTKAITFDTTDKIELNASQKINIGLNADEPAVLGNKLVSLLQDLITQIQAITVNVSGVESTPPVNIAAFDTIAGELDTILSQLVFIKPTS